MEGRNARVDKCITDCAVRYKDSRDVYEDVKNKITKDRIKNVKMKNFNEAEFN